MVAFHLIPNVRNRCCCCCLISLFDFVESAFCLKLFEKKDRHQFIDFNNMIRKKKKYALKSIIVVVDSVISKISGLFDETLTRWTLLTLSQLLSFFVTLMTFASQIRWKREKNRKTETICDNIYTFNHSKHLPLGTPYLNLFRSDTCKINMEHTLSIS